MKIKGLLPSGEEDPMQGKLLGHKEEGVITMQMVGRLRMGNPIKMCHQDAAHNVPQTALQGEGAVAQAIALLHQVNMKEDIQGTREGGHQLLSYFPPTSPYAGEMMRERFDLSSPLVIPFADGHTRVEEYLGILGYGCVRA